MIFEEAIKASEGASGDQVEKTSLEKIIQKNGW